MSCDARVKVTSPLRAGVTWAIHHPRSTATVLAFTVGTCYLGYQTVLLSAAAVVVVAASWRLLDQPSFDRFAGRLLRAWYRRWWLYQRQWFRITHAIGLVGSDPQGELVTPKILRVSSSWCWDTLHIRLAKHQEPGDYEQVLERLAHAYRARRATVRVLKPGKIALSFQRREPFDELHIPVPPLPLTPQAVSLAKLHVGRDEYGTPFHLSLEGARHTLVAGASESGKGSVVWAMLRSLAPMIRDGQVRVWAIDPKGGMELGIGKDLFHRFADNDQDGLELLADYTDLLDDRKLTLGRQGIRKIAPSREMPLELLIVDELAAMTEYADRSIQREFEPMLSKALTQYRAPLGRVIGAVQEPTKDNVPMRGLFTVKIALRLDSASYVDMCLGEGMRDMGALADQIPDYMPGLGFCKVDGRREPVRFRAAYSTDDDIHELVRFTTSVDSTVVDSNVVELHPDHTETAV